MFKRLSKWIQGFSADAIASLIVNKIVTLLSTIHFIGISICSICKFIENNGSMNF